MNATAMAEHGTAGTGRRGGDGRWTRWVPYAAGLWSLAYGIVALIWTLTGSGFPLGENDPGGRMSLLAGLPADVGAPLFAAAGLAGGSVGLVMARVRRPGTEIPPWSRRIGLACGVALTAALLAVVPDTRVFALVGYLPMLIVQAPFDADMRDQLGALLGPVYLHHLASLVGGFLWLLATLVFARRTAGTCERCGRGTDVSGWTSPVSAARWRRWCVGIAVLVPMLYAATLWIWVAGVPLGVSEEFHAAGTADGSLWSGAWLGSFALVGAVLTLGLVQRWGEVFPRWLPGVAGRSVPVGLAVVPAAVVSALAISGGLGMIAVSWRDGHLPLTSDTWAAIGPTLIWPVWGVALAAATWAYYLRRRPACEHGRHAGRLLRRPVRNR